MKINIFPGSLKMKISTLLLIATAIFLFSFLSIPSLAQEAYNPQTNQWEYRPRPDTPTAGGGRIDSRTGTYFAPSGTGGVVNTQDGTQWMRSGDFLFDTRSGGAVHSPGNQ